MLVTGLDGANGGVTVGRELSIALAAEGHDVTVRVSTPVASVNEFARQRVHVQVLDPIPGLDERGQLLQAQNLPTGVDVIIGHGRFTGGAASYLRDAFYPNAKAVHIVHALPDDLDRFRNDPLQATSHANTERLLIAKADLVMGIGPLLTEEAARMARMADLPPIVAELPPGVITGPPVTYNYPQRYLNMLLFGRADDPLKGVEIAAATVRQLNTSDINVRLTVLGANPETINDDSRRLSERAQSVVRVKPFTTDRSRITAEIRAADVVVMPSLHEGFGLVATEAMGHGIPTYVSSTSGAGWLFADQTRFPATLQTGAVVPTPPGASPQETVKTWTSHLSHALSPANLADTRTRYEQLRTHLANHYSWRHTARQLITTAQQSLQTTRSQTEPTDPQRRPIRRRNNGPELDL